MLVKPAGVVSSSGRDAVDLSAACGLVMDAWQADALDVAMGERADGSWAASDVVMIASRQNGKNVLIEARELFGAVVLHEQIIHTSHLFKTTRESFGRLRDLIDSNRDVKDCLVGQVASAQSGFEMRFRGGGRITFIARSRSSGRGLTGDLLVFDEAQDLNDDAQGALLPTISARPGAQAWYLGSAPGLESTVFHRFRKRGRAGSDTRLAYFEFSADPDCDPDDHFAQEQANPAMAYGRITREAVESERRAMSTEMFMRERLSISPDIDEAASVIPAASWSAACSSTLEVTAEWFAIDMNPERSAAGIVAGGSGPTLEVVDFRPGTSWLVGRAVELYDRWALPFALDGTGPAGSLIAELEDAHIPVVAFGSAQLTKATGAFYDAVLNGTVKVRTNTDLDRAVAAADKLMVGDAFKWGRKGSKADICLLVAATIALGQVGDGTSIYEQAGLMAL